MSILIAIYNAVLDIIARQKLSEQREIRLQKDVSQILSLLLFEQAATITFSATIDGKTSVGVSNVTLTDSQKAVLSITVLDAKKNPAQLDGVPAWATSYETIATIDTSADPTGMSAVLFGVRPGSCTVTVTGDADLGEGVVPIVGTLDVSVTPGQAVIIAINAGEVSEQ